jgi:hypothetical protein
MLSFLRRILGREIEWRLYFVRRSVGLEYALHNKSAWGILGYLQSTFENGQRISDEWKLHMSYFAGTKEDQFQLTEAMFTDPAQFKALISRCESMDAEFHNEQIAEWSPYFVHVSSRKRLPLGGPPMDADRADIHRYIESRLAGKDEGMTFSEISGEVFVEAKP